MSANLDLILFGMIAVFLVLRLRSVLGRRTGFERPDQPAIAPAATGRVSDGQAVKVPEPPRRALPDPASPTGQVLMAIQRAEPAFDPTRFLDGAEAAFRRIVTAFAAGERTALAPLLTEATFNAFIEAIKTREAAGETQVSEIKSILDALIEHAVLHPGPNNTQIADITVRFVSHQTNMVKDKDGNLVTGSDGITELADMWSFERILGSPEPTWRLASAQSA